MPLILTPSFPQEYDLNKDGLISFGEFEQAMKAQQDYTTYTHTHTHTHTHTLLYVMCIANLHLVNDLGFFACNIYADTCIYMCVMHFIVGVR